MKVPFIKMQGLGNDFIVIDDLQGPTIERSPGDAWIDPQWVRKVCDRRFGVGADQILWLVKPDGQADARMEIRNSDGSTAEMCGNGIRAVALYLANGKRKREKQNPILIETAAGLKSVEVIGDHAKVDMGIPKIVRGKNFPKKGEALEVGLEVFQFYEINVGNPHAVIFCEDMKKVDIGAWGPLVENHSRFPNKTNVEWVSLKNHTEIEVRVWERGAGITLACGTGACAAAVIALATQKVSGTVEVHLPGGSLWIEWKGDGHSVFMEGPAQEVFRGEI